MRKISEYFKVPVDYLIGMDYVMEDSNDEYLKDETLLKYLEQPNENTVLIFVVNGKIDGKKKKLYKYNKYYISIHNI